MEPTDRKFMWKATLAVLLWMTVTLALALACLLFTRWCLFGFLPLVLVLGGSLSAR
jgi:hypothetical protein